MRDRVSCALCRESRYVELRYTEHAVCTAGELIVLLNIEVYVQVRVAI